MPDEQSRTFAGAVLAGGASRRMGRDKALVEIAGRPLIAIAAAALDQAGASEVVVAGGTGLDRVGLRAVPDLYPGQGPLGGIITALRATSEPAVVILTCDLPAITAAEVEAVLAALHAHPEADVAAPLMDGRPQFLTAAYRRRALEPLERAFAAGERAVRRAVASQLICHEFDGLDPHRLADVDTPADLADAAGMAGSVADPLAE